MSERPAADRSTQLDDRSLAQHAEGKTFHGSVHILLLSSVIFSYTSLMTVKSSMDKLSENCRLLLLQRWCVDGETRAWPEVNSSVLGRVQRCRTGLLLLKPPCRARPHSHLLALVPACGLRQVVLLLMAMILHGPPSQAPYRVHLPHTHTHTCSAKVQHGHGSIDA